MNINSVIRNIDSSYARSTIQIEIEATKYKIFLRLYNYHSCQLKSLYISFYGEVEEDCYRELLNGYLPSDFNAATLSSLSYIKNKYEQIFEQAYNVVQTEANMIQVYFTGV